jgi:hypothetical protein
MLRAVRILALVMIGGCAASGGGADGGTGGMDARSGDGGRIDAAARDATTADATPEGDASAADGGSSDAAAGDAALTDAGTATDAGCTPGTSRSCTLTCTSGGSAMGRETCISGDAWTPCERRPELCGNGLDDDGDGEIDEDCRVEGTCIWVRPQCQGVMTLNAICAAAGGRHLVAGRRCPVAGSAVVPLDAAYGTYPLCCCNVASMCVPECEDPTCSSCVVWDEIQCCL